MNNKTALLVGASGLIGQELLKLLLAETAYQKVIVLVRKPVGITHPKLDERITNFDNIELGNLSPNDVFCTLGTTIKKAGSKALFRKVDEDYPLSVAKSSYENGADFFGIVTAMGADSKSSIFYNQVKGDVEVALQSIGFKHLAIFRPSMLAGDRKEKRLGEQIGSVLMTALGFLIPDNYKIIHVKKVAEAMINYAQNPNKPQQIFLSGEML